MYVKAEISAADASINICNIDHINADVVESRFARACDNKVAYWNKPSYRT
jgi:hypothetical protein